MTSWYSWNANHPDVRPIPIGLNEDSQLHPMSLTKRAKFKIEKLVVNFKQDREERQLLFNQVKDLPYVHVEPYSKKWQNTHELTIHYETLSKYKWTLCPRGAGQDTHRLWEAHLGSIPVVLKVHFVIVQWIACYTLNNWDELSLELLQERSNTLQFDRTNAYFKHWEDMIRSTNREIHVDQSGVNTPNQAIPSASHLDIVPKDIGGTVGSQAENNVDKLISNTLFQKNFVGTFVEFGCSNGIRNSNSLLLEREYGWDGLCIEPNPFEATFAIKNRKHGIHALISYPAQDYKYAAMSGHCAQGSGIVEFMNEKSKKNLKTCPKARGEQLRYVTIPGVNLETLLEENHMPSVTWISADCEGCELSFIQNFDFDKYDVRVISYETSANQETGTNIENLLTEKGFSKHNWKGNDAVYVRNMDQNTHTTKIISFSLYGSNPRYTDGAIANAKLVSEVYPGWIMRVYHDNTVPEYIIHKLKSDGVELVDMSGSEINKMSWRFLATADADYFCSRDIDSRLSKREALAVQEWIESGKKFHVMRDHPSHSNYPMSGGMWCSTTIKNIHKLLVGHTNQAYLEDMNFLTDVIWNMARKSLMQTDSFSCDKFGGGKPFPTLRVGWEHVGSVYIIAKCVKAMLIF